eukprot:TRINITY_DN5229_c0_g1_i4.p1 TRINITY_DN5229_c0_g1~~TRINITY_DN5229_c0_g1_i4.p1  ORF type:complete len:110 (+),score=19.60 TRINITY_DN5229_c0_g1_i4:326-655(+)
MISNGFSTCRTHNPDWEPMAFKSIILTDSATHYLLARQNNTQPSVRGKASDEEDHTWVAMHISCYSSQEATEYSEKLTDELLASHGRDENDHPLSQLLLSFSNLYNFIC